MSGSLGPDLVGGHLGDGVVRKLGGAAGRRRVVFRLDLERRLPRARRARAEATAAEATGRSGRGAEEEGREGLD